MKKLRLLGFCGFILITLGCNKSNFNIDLGFLRGTTVPIEIIKPKINGIIEDMPMHDITYLSIDSKNNLYFNQKNVIKKMDSDGNITVIGGEEKKGIDLAIYPADKIIDGELNKAKFGEIKKVVYVEKENAVYFEDYYNRDRFDSSTVYSFLRKIANNKVVTISDTSVSSDNAHNYYFDSFGNILESPKIEFKGNIIDIEGTSYYINTKQYEMRTLQVLKEDNTWQDLIEPTPHRISVSVDKNNNLYILENTLYTNNLGGISPKSWRLPKITISGYSPTIIHKIPKKTILAANGSIDLDKKDFVIGELAEKSGFGSSMIVSFDGTKLYLVGINSIAKINIGEKNDKYQNNK